MGLARQCKKSLARIHYLRNKGKLSADEAEELGHRLGTQKSTLVLTNLFGPFRDRGGGHRPRQQQQLSQRGTFLGRWADLKRLTWTRHVRPQVRKAGVCYFWRVD